MQTFPTVHRSFYSNQWFLRYGPIFQHWDIIGTFFWLTVATTFMFLQIIRSFYSFIIEKYKIYHKHTIFCIFLIFYIQISTIILQIVLSSVFKQFRTHYKICKYLTAFQTQTLCFAYHSPHNLFSVYDWNWDNDLAGCYPQGVWEIFLSKV